MTEKTDLNRDMAQVLIDEAALLKRVAQLGAELSAEYEGKDPILVCILKGAVHFFSDLTRHITCHMEMDFMSISSYGGGTKTSGIVRIAKDLDNSITGRHVLIVEDIMDSGLTLHHLTTLLKTRQPASLKIVCLLDKPERRECDIAPDYTGFAIPNVFAAGYGLDYNNHYRNVPYVGELKPEIYC